MVCVPCIVIPLLLWVFHKWIQPFMIKFWNPWQQKSVLDFNESSPPKDVAAEDPSYKYIKEKALANTVMLFSKTTCNFCSKAKQLLDELKIDYAVEEIDKREDCKELQDMFEKLTGQRTVPRVYISGKCVGGYSDLYTLHNQGKVQALVGENKAQASDKKRD